jgi:hypothetical protein
MFISQFFVQSAIDGQTADTAVKNSDWLISKQKIPRTVDSGMKFIRYDNLFFKAREAIAKRRFNVRRGFQTSV